ncbi:MAG: hypothetical protein GXY83_37705 [Rhodopirellula sp.]|nr:hypothetical protein [Rhodopirellula sp.]
MAIGMHRAGPAYVPADDFFVPGTCFSTHHRQPELAAASVAPLARDPRLRDGYLEAALADIPRLLGAIDRNPYRPTYGCLDRQYWHYRTSSFPSEMYQEGVLPLALVSTTKLPGNRWYGCERIRELAIAALRFNLRSSHRDGSCDDYYPFERALGAAVFSLRAAACAYQLLGLDEPELIGWFRRRAEWILANDESGRLANHHALAALGLLCVAEITADSRYRAAADARVERVLRWQDEEGWFEEYGGADPGYQSVTIDCLAKYRQATGDTRLDEPLARAVAFSRIFLHPDDSYGGPYGSRGTSHFYPHGMELLARRHSAAADLADAFLRSLAAGTFARFDDDRLFIHRLGNLIEAWQDWSPERPAPDERPSPIHYLPHAQLLVRSEPKHHTVISAARAGVFKHFNPAGGMTTDAGLLVEMTDHRLAVSQWHNTNRPVELLREESGDPNGLVVRTDLCWNRCETATPLKQSILHLGMVTIGRWCRTLARKALQRRLITGRSPAPIRLTRRVELIHPAKTPDAPSLRVTDTIELTSPAVSVLRMAYGTDCESAYVAATGGYQEAVLQSWNDLSLHVDALNAAREVTIVREF